MPVHPEARPKWTNGVIPRAPRRIFLQMSVEQAMPGRLVRWLSAAEPDWDAVYADQLPRVYNFFRYRFGVTADAEDLTARTFEKAWRARHRYRRDVAAFSTWLLSIARNAARGEQQSQEAVDLAVGELLTIYFGEAGEHPAPRFRRRRSPASAAASRGPRRGGECGDGDWYTRRRSGSSLGRRAPGGVAAAAA